MLRIAISESITSVLWNDFTTNILCAVGRFSFLVYALVTNELDRFPEPWNYLLTFNIYIKKSFKVSQSPRVPRVRGGDPSGVAPGKVEGFFSAPGHPWKLFS